MNSSAIPYGVTGVVLEGAGDELFAFNPADEMMHALNASAAAVLSACDGKRSVEAIIAELGGQDLTAEMVELGLAELSEAGLIVLGPDVVDMPSRRELLLKLGAGAALVAAIPVVESIMAPAAAAASSAPTPTPTPTPTPAPTPTPTPTEWDKSSYKAGAIDARSATAEVCNDGDGPGTTKVKYDVLYSAEGNPMKVGVSLYTGYLAPLGRGCGTVDWSAQKRSAGAGRYKVRFYQAFGHPGTGVLYSETAECRVPR